MSDDRELYERMQREANKQAYVDSEYLRRRELEEARRQAARNSPQARRIDAMIEAKRAAEEQRRQELRAQDEEIRKQREAEREKRIDEELRPRRAQLKRQWLIDHPHEDPWTFDYKVWPLMKKQLKETEFSHEARVAAEVEKMKRSGRYSF
jgi:hypothetical protein